MTQACRYRRRWELGQDKIICVRCGATSKPKGVSGLEVLLWVLGVVPGAIYHFARRRSRARKCRKCGGDAFRVNSVEGAAIAKHFDGRLM